MKILDISIDVGNETYISTLTFYSSANAADSVNETITDYIIDELGKNFVKKSNSR